MSVTSTIKGGSVEAKFSVTINKKFQSALIYIQFDTSEKDLLSLLLQKYVSEKVLTTGLNANNSALSAVAGETSIAIFAPENKITQNVLFLYAYLNKTKLSSAQSKLIKSGDYDRLSSDIKKFSVEITGKCKNFAAALQNNAPKIDRLKQSLSAVATVNREAIKNTDVKTDFYETTLTDASSTAALYLSIAMDNIPCTIHTSGKNITLRILSPNGRELLQSRTLFRDTFQAKVKSFLTQSGSVGSPSANDKGGVAYKAKCKTILECENVLAFIYSDLRGFKFSFSSEDELKKVDSEAMSKVRNLK